MILILLIILGGMSTALYNQILAILIGGLATKLLTQSLVGTAVKLVRGADSSLIWVWHLTPFSLVMYILLIGNDLSFLEMRSFERNKI